MSKEKIAKNICIISDQIKKLREKNENMNRLLLVYEDILNPKQIKKMKNDIKTTKKEMKIMKICLNEQISKLNEFFMN
jgi:hypothetical protein